MSRWWQEQPLRCPHRLGPDKRNPVCEKTHLWCGQTNQLGHHRQVQCPSEGLRGATGNKGGNSQGTGSLGSWGPTPVKGRSHAEGHLRVWESLLAPRTGVLATPTQTRLLQQRDAFGTEGSWKKSFGAKCLLGGIICTNDQRPALEPPHSDAL